MLKNIALVWDSLLLIQAIDLDYQSAEGSQFPWKSEQLVWTNVELLQAILPKNVLEQDEMGETCIAPMQCRWSALDTADLRVTFWME